MVDLRSGKDRRVNKDREKEVSLHTLAQKIEAASNRELTKTEENSMTPHF